MTFETIIYNALRALVADRCYADPPSKPPARPYIRYQQVGGDAVNYVDPAIPDKSNARFQINVWADTRTQASTVAKQVEDAMRMHPTLQTTVLGARVSINEEDSDLLGTRQDFSVWE